MSSSRMSRFLAFLAVVLASPQSVSAAPLSIQDYQGIRYVTGGVGQDERDYLKSVKQQFNLGLMFAASGGAYLSDVHITVTDSHGGTVLDAVADGPYFYAALPAGSYTITASVERLSQQRRVNIGSGRFTQADFYWR